MHIEQPASTDKSARDRLSPQERARVCEAIRHELALEYLHGRNSRREVWARICIGLRPFPRPFNRWWRENVSIGHGRKNADPRSLNVVDAEEITGIAQQQVSKWAKRLQEGASA
jgi:hypothetical protein